MLNFVTEERRKTGDACSFRSIRCCRPSCTSFGAREKFLGLLPRPQAGSHHLPYGGIDSFLAIGLSGEDRSQASPAYLGDTCGRLLGVCREFVYLLLCRASNRRGPHRSVASFGRFYCQVSLRILSTNCAASLIERHWLLFHQYHCWELEPESLPSWWGARLNGGCFLTFTICGRRQAEAQRRLTSWELH